MVGSLWRVWRAGLGPVRGDGAGTAWWTSRSRLAHAAATLLDQPDAARLVRDAEGEDIGSLDDIAAASLEPSGEVTRLLAPCDLQAIKACGVTFAGSMVERVIEERAARRSGAGAGDPRAGRRR